ncbi:hypothetical protein [Phytomonospora endophytica]|uniref:Lipoprotein n=1 Tax=Phytomonospora endophytica TaxID=714109 RepID=A0A841FZ35_9ACTN|nr:hypothetical protein [Phytomonospora endophytica]MBB6037210.1 hypothetical protein [Phytomonospora endophytica]GIG71289.1 hypothetical protein Pen01_75840 [Phytomonospora endophytica]
MLTPRRRALSISLTAVALLAAGCTKATVNAAPWGAPLDAVTAAAAGLADGVAFRGVTEADSVSLATNGEEIPAEHKFRLYQEVSSGVANIATELRLIGDELWMRISGLGGDGDWGHIADGAFLGETADVVGPSVWAPELFAQITTIERIGEQKYGGVLDLTEADPDRTGIDKAIMRDLPDEAEEVEFSVSLNADGTLNTLTLEIDDTAQGDVTIDYSFTKHGAPNDVTEPDGKIVEVTDENAMEWFAGS